MIELYKTGDLLCEAIGLRNVGSLVTGFGLGVDPGWSAKIDRCDHTDLCNQYLLILTQFGLIGFVPFIAMNIEAIKNLVRAYKRSITDFDRGIVWSLSAAVCGLAVAFFTVSLFGQTTTIYFWSLDLPLHCIKWQDR